MKITNKKYKTKIRKLETRIIIYENMLKVLANEKQYLEGSWSWNTPFNVKCNILRLH